MSVQPLDELFAGHAGPWTEHDWLALPDVMGRVELLDGALLVSPQAGVGHQRFCGNLRVALQAAAPDSFEVLDAYARAGIPHYFRVDLDRGVDQLGATHYGRTDAGYVPYARSRRGRLTLDRPFPVDLDLPALTRPAGNG